MVLPRSSSGQNLFRVFVNTLNCFIIPPPGGSGQTHYDLMRTFSWRNIRQIKSMIFKI